MLRSTVEVRDIPRYGAAHAQVQQAEVPGQRYQQRPPPVCRVSKRPDHQGGQSEVDDSGKGKGSPVRQDIPELGASGATGGVSQDVGHQCPWEASSSASQVPGRCGRDWSHTDSCAQLGTRIAFNESSPARRYHFTEEHLRCPTPEPYCASPISLRTPDTPGTSSRACMRGLRIIL